VVSLSERASGESAWLVLGLPGAALALGLVEGWTAIGCVAGIIASWILVARRLRELSGRYDALTLPELFDRAICGAGLTEYASPEDRRWGHILRVSASLIITFFFVFYVSAQFIGAGKVLERTLQIPPSWGMLIGAGLIVFYTILGGFLAVAWTDVAQGLIMFLTLVILPIAGIIELGGWEAFQGGFAKAAGSGGHLLGSLTGGKTGAAAFAAVVGGLSWGLGYLGQPHLLVRYMSIRDVDQIGRSRRIAFTWAVPAFTGALMIGLVGAVLYGLPEGGDPEQIMPLMAIRLLPGWLAGIFMSGAIAAMMSTADSQLLVASSALTEDLYRRIVNPDAEPGRLLTLGRLATLTVGLLALVLAWSSDDLVFAMVGFAWSGLGSSFGPLLLFLLFGWPLGRKGALAGMLTGALVTVIWKVLPDTVITERVVSFAAAFAVLAVCAILTRRGRIN